MKQREKHLCKNNFKKINVSQHVFGFVIELRC